MLLFFCISAIIIILAFCSYIVFKNSEFKIIINNLIYSSKGKKNKLQYDIKIGVFFYGNRKICSFNVSNINEISMKNNQFIKRVVYKKFLNKKWKDSKKKDIKPLNSKEKILLLIKPINENVTIEQLELKSYIDAEDVITTTYIVTLLSVIFPNIIRKYVVSKPQFEILPIYKNQKYFYLQLNSIISFKLVHITNMLKVIRDKI